MARTPNGVGPIYTAQIIFMVKAETAGRAEAWRHKLGIRTRSDLHREIYEAGLAVLEKKAVRRYGKLKNSELAAAIADVSRKTGDPTRSTEVVNLTGRPVEATPAKRASKAATKRVPKVDGKPLKSAPRTAAKTDATAA
jgi:hypothetical protein